MHLNVLLEYSCGNFAAASLSCLYSALPLARLAQAVLQYRRLNVPIALNSFPHRPHFTCLFLYAMLLDLQLASDALPNAVTQVVDVDSNVVVLELHEPHGLPETDEIHVVASL